MKNKFDSRGGMTVRIPSQVIQRIRDMNTLIVQRGPKDIMLNETQRIQNDVAEVIIALVLKELE